MKIVLGLGNPGARYVLTRHNVGFRVLDLLAERAGVAYRREEDLGQDCWTAEVVLSGTEVVLAKPRTFMNRSGRAGLALLERFAATPEDLVVVHDDADLALGRLRVRTEGSAGGHNGLRSLIATIRSSAFPRVKLGVRGEGRGEADLADYVLEEFLDAELETAASLVVLGADAVRAVFEEGITAAMNRFNGGTPLAETREPC